MNRTPSCRYQKLLFGSMLDGGLLCLLLGLFAAAQFQRSAPERSQGAVLLVRTSGLGTQPSYTPRWVNPEQDAAPDFNDVRELIRETEAADEQLYIAYLNGGVVVSDPGDLACRLGLDWQYGIKVDARILRIERGGVGAEHAKAWTAGLFVSPCSPDDPEFNELYAEAARTLAQADLVWASNEPEQVDTASVSFQDPAQGEASFTWLRTSPISRAIFLAGPLLLISALVTGVFIIAGSTRSRSVAMA